jgi:GAF domain-containing protein
MVQPLSSDDWQAKFISLEAVLQTLRETEEIDILIETLVDYLQKEFNYHLIWISLYDWLEHRLLGKGGAVNGNQDFLKQKLPLSASDLLEQVVIQLEPLYISDLRDEKRAGEWRKIAQNHNIQGTTIAPIKYKGRCFGLALLGSEIWGFSPTASETAKLSMVLGQLGATLYEIETSWQRQQVKRADIPLLSLLAELRTLNSLDQRLEAVVEATHGFIEPNRTNVYWYYPDGRYFWRRVSHREVTPVWHSTSRPASGITVQDLGAFYSAMTADQIVWIGESHSSLKSDITEKLMLQIRSRSLLAAPIVFESELLGFLAVEANHPRIWQEHEKNYIRAVAQLVALTSPLSEMEKKIQRVREDYSMIDHITRSIAQGDAWQKTLEITAEELINRLDTEHILLVTERQSEFTIVYQNQPSNGRLIASPLPKLSPAELALLQPSENTVIIENWQEDERFLAWRQHLESVGVRSLLIYRLQSQKEWSQLSGFLIIGHPSSRTWSPLERELVKNVSHHLSLILHQWQFTEEIDKKQEYWQYLELGLDILQPVPSLVTLPIINKIIPPPNLQAEGITKVTRQLMPNQEPQLLNDPVLNYLEQRFLEFIANGIIELTETNSHIYPLILLVTWMPDMPMGKLSSCAANSEFALNNNIAVSINTDPLIQKVLHTEEEWFRCSATKIPDKSRRWLGVLDRGEIGAIALRTAPEHQVLGILVIADPAGHLWANSQSKLSGKMAELLNVLIRQLAWSRRYLLLQSKLSDHNQELEWLTWYKQRRLEEIYQTLGNGLKQLAEISQVMGDSSQPQKDTLTNLHYQQLLRRLTNYVGNTNNLLKKEKWHLQANYDVVAIGQVWRRCIDRLHPILKKRQLQLEAQKPGNYNVITDSLKLELILYELLSIACYLAHPGTHLKVHCKPVDDQWLEVLIFQKSVIELKLTQAIQIGTVIDFLDNSPLAGPPGKHLLICKQIMQQLSGDLHIELQEDGLLLTRLLIPLVPINEKTV